MIDPVELQEALDLLAAAWRINRRNVIDFEHRLKELAEIGKELRGGKCSPDHALQRAEQLGFVAPVLAEGA